MKQKRLGIFRQSRIEQSNTGIPEAPKIDIQSRLDAADGYIAIIKEDLEYSKKKHSHLLAQHLKTLDTLSLVSIYAIGLTSAVIMYAFWKM